MFEALTSILRHKLSGLETNPFGLLSYIGGSRPVSYCMNGFTELDPGLTGHFYIADTRTCYYTYPQA